MQLRQLINVLKYVNQNFETNNMSELYRELVTALNQARENPTQESTDDIVRFRAAIRTSHNSAEPRKWNYAQRKLYDKFGAAQLLGMGANEEIERIFESHSADPGGAAKSIGGMIQRTDQLIQRVRSLLEGLGPLADDEDLEVDEDKTSLQLFFEDNASIETIADLEKSSEGWTENLRAFARLTRVPAEDAKIVTIEQGSLIIGLMTAIVVALAVAKAASASLGVYEKYLNIKKLGLEAANLRLQNQQISSQLEAEAETLLDTTAEDVATQLLQEYGWDKDENTGELQTTVQMSVKRIFEFVRDGGKIDVYEPEETGTEVQEQLKEAFSRIRSLEGTVEQLALPDPQEDSDQRANEDA